MATCNRFLIFITIILLNLINTQIAIAESNEELSGANNSEKSPRPLTFSIDKNFSMHVGSNLAQSMLWGYQLVDDALISPTTGDRQVTTMFARFGKALLEHTLASWTMVLQHERFGHGARGREFGIPGLSYSVKPFSGSTYFYLSDFNSLTPAKKVAFITGGMEANSLLAADLRENWLNGTAIDVRAAQLYFVTALDQTFYILRKSKDDTTLGNDINNYVSNVNQWHGNNDATSKSKLRKFAKLDFLDPFLIYSAFSMVNYVATGEQTYDYYMLPIADFKYLPSFRTVLAPWGPEWQFNNYIKNSSGQLLFVGLRHGSSGDKSSTGLTVKLSEVFVWNNIAFDARGDLWKQPDLNANSLSTAGNKAGLAAYTTASYKLNPNVKVMGQLGCKSLGFMQGEPLKAGLIFRAALGLTL